MRRRRTRSPEVLGQRHVGPRMSGLAHALTAVTPKTKVWQSQGLPRHKQDNTAADILNETTCIPHCATEDSRKPHSKNRMAAERNDREHHSRDAGGPRPCDTS